jgi:hypothetical protein
MDLDKKKSIWSQDCTDHKNGIDFYIIISCQIAVKDLQILEVLQQSKLSKFSIKKTFLYLYW